MGEMVVETSLRGRALGLGLRVTVRPVVEAWTLLPTVPWPYWTVDFAGLLPRSAPGTTLSEHKVGDVRVQTITPRHRERQRTILHFHGGAFLVGGWHLHRGLLSRIAKLNSAEVITVQYRKLPVHPISASIEDCLAVYRDLIEQGRDPRDIVLLGDSAGGYLAFSVLAAAAQEGLPMPSAVVGLSPLCELSASEIVRVARGCAVFGPGAVAALSKFATVRETNPGHPTPRDVVPELMPPVLIQAAEGECLYPQIKRYAQRLKRGGVDCRLDAHNIDIHVFQAAGWLPEARRALVEMQEFLASVTWADVDIDAALA